MFVIVQQFRDTQLFYRIRDVVETWRERSRIRRWIRDGLPAPPPHSIKQAVVRSYARRFGIRVLVETGTYRGDMVEAMKRHFDEIYSIELSDVLFQKARQRFNSCSNVHLIHGDSADAMASVLSEIEGPALFWLDGHWSGGITAMGRQDTPVRGELNALLNVADRGHVILVDDARCFGGDPAYPTIEELQTEIMAAGLSINVDVDIIRITPRTDVCAAQ